MLLGLRIACAAHGMLLLIALARPTFPGPFLPLPTAHPRLPKNSFTEGDGLGMDAWML